jgi:hypothetical protein
MDPPELPMDSEQAGRAVLLARMAVLVALGLAAIRIAWAPALLAQTTAFGIGCATMLVFSPISWVHYFMCLAPPVLLTPIWMLRNDRIRTAWVVACIPPALVLTHYVWLGGAGRVGLLGLGLTAWLLVTLGAIMPATQVLASAAAVDRDEHRPTAPATNASQGEPARSAA